jgi:hypothetical protein
MFGNPGPCILRKVTGTLFIFSSPKHNERLCVRRIFWNNERLPPLLSSVRVFRFDGIHFGGGTCFAVLKAVFMVEHPSLFGKTSTGTYGMYFFH